MKKLLSIVVLGLLCLNTTFAADNIKPKKTPLKKLSKQLGNGELVKIQSKIENKWKGQGTMRFSKYFIQVSENERANPQ